MPSTLHSLVQNNLIYELNHRYRSNYSIFPELSLISVDGKPLVPDIAIYPKFEVDWQNDVIRREDTPLATVEILSPKQNLSDLNEKARRYFEMGVASCWIVLPSMEAIAVNHQPGKYRFFSGDETLIDEKIKVELPLTEVFR